MWAPHSRGAPSTLSSHECIRKVGATPASLSRPGPWVSSPGASPPLSPSPQGVMVHAPPPPSPDLCAQPPRPRLCLHCCRELTQLLSTLAPFWLPSTSSWPGLWGLQSTDSAATLPRPPPSNPGEGLGHS